MKGKSVWHLVSPSFVVVVLATGLVTVAPVPAAAQIQTSAQARCVSGMNKRGEKLASTHRRQIAGCVKDATRSSLPGGLDAQSCVENQQLTKLAKAKDKVLREDVKRCAAEPPDFGYVGGATMNAVVVGQELALVADLFGPDLAASVAPAVADRELARCQAAIAKSYGRPARERMRAFNRCKKEVLASGQVASEIELETTCFAAIENDVKGKIEKAFVKLGSAFIKRCNGVVDVAAAFPGACVGAPDFLTCLDQRVACRACLSLNNMDALGADCERLDNGVFDGSCVDPDANECAGENGGHNCHADASCTDEIDGFSCECLPGFSGDGVICADDDECLGEGSGNDCDANAACTNLPGSFSCACNSGFVGDGTTCTDLNECIGEGTGNDCDTNATCSNLPGSFSCTCNSGWLGDGVTCVDANECVGEGAGNDCDANATCTNLPGSFSCACNSGFVGDGTVCADLDECIGEGTGNDCDANATCTNLPGSFQCTCNPGWLGDGVSCVDANECIGEGAGNNCDTNATCTNLPGGFSCACDAGYNGDGVTCVDDDECAGEGSGNNCSVNANCINLPGTFDCECMKLHFGDPFGGVCSPIELQITAPVGGVFTQASSIAVTGTVTADPLGDVSLAINGSSVAIQPGGTFSTTVFLDSVAIFNPIVAQVTQISTGFTMNRRVTVIAGASAVMGGQVDGAVGLRITDTGFDELEPVLGDLVGLDINSLLPPGTVVIEDVCVQDSIFGCTARIDKATVNIATLGGFGLDVDSMTDFVAGDVRLDDLVVDLRVDLVILGISSTCDSFVVSATTTDILGDYELKPDIPDPVSPVVEVDQVGPVQVVFSNFDTNADCGGTGFLTFIVEAVSGDLQNTTQQAFEDFLDDPDGSGPQDAPIAQAIEDAFVNLEITGPIGDGFGVDLTTPVFDVPEDGVGVTISSHASMTTQTPAPGAPTFAETLLIPATFPKTELMTDQSPGGSGFDMAITISDSGFNQILASQVEQGLLQTEITELELIPGNPIPLTAAVLASFLPQFGQLDPGLALTVRISPTLAPVLTGNTGPAGEVAELVISHLLIDIVSGPAGMETLHGRIAGDMLTAFDLTIDGGSGALVPALSEPDVEDIGVTLLDNPLCVSDASVEALVPQLLIPVIPSLSSLLQPIPLPEFLGLQPTPIEVERIGDHMGVFLSVQTMP